MPFDVAYEARLQVDHLSAPEKSELERLFSGREPSATPAESLRNHFISKLGDKRVLWRPGKSGQPEILAVVDRSYAA